MSRVIVVGGGFAGCAAAVSAAHAGAAVTLVERTDVLLGNSSMYGGYMNPNGRFVGAEEAKALGAGDLFTALESITLHERVELPGLEGAYTFDACLAEPTIRRVVEAANVTIQFKSRAVDVVQEGSRITAVACQHYGEDQEEIAGDVFIDCTGGTGGPAYCAKYGSGCVMCTVKCYAWGPRLSIATKAGAAEYRRLTPDGRGILSGGFYANIETVSPAIQRQLRRDGCAIIPLPEEFIDEGKMRFKACKHLARKDFAKSLVLIHEGSTFFEVCHPFFPLELLRQVPGFERVRVEHPTAGKGNSVRYVSIAPRDNSLRVDGVPNLFCAGEKSGPIVGHTEGIVTGALAGHNATRATVERDGVILPGDTAIGDFIAFVGRQITTERGPTYTFAGSVYFERMQERGLYTRDTRVITDRIADLGLTGVLATRVV
jgi:hypothetical protein